MKVRQVHTSFADRKSAKMFFDVLHGMYDLKQMRALDAFARNGELTVSNYWDSVRSLECWELCREHEVELREYTNNVRIGCSYRLIEHAKDIKSRFDLIVIDTPQGLHTAEDGRVHAEHFQFLTRATSLIDEGGVIVLYVNKQPYDRRVMGSHGYDEYKEYDFDRWMEARKQFYGMSTISEEIALANYRQLLRLQGLNVRRVIQVPCFSDVKGVEPYAFRLGLEVSRV